MTPEQHRRLLAVINREPTHFPVPRMTLAEIDDLRSLVAAGREADAWAVLSDRSTQAWGGAFQRVRVKSQEMVDASERKRMEAREHAARLDVLEAQKNAALRATLPKETEPPTAMIDIEGERGCRRLILECWPKIVSRYGPSPDGRQVWRVIEKEKDASEDMPILKTVQNKLSELRKEGKIP